MPQQLVLFPEGGTYRLQTEFTRTPVGMFSDATTALQSAMELASDGGGIVTLGAGEYPLVAPIRLPSNVWVRGAGRTTRLRVTPTNSIGIGLLAETAHGAVVSDLMVYAQETTGIAGIVLDGCSACTLRDLFCAGFAVYGVWVRNSSFLCDIRACHFAGNGRANLYFDELHQGPHGDFLPNLVAGCLIYGGGTGIECRHALTLHISGCAVHQTKGPAYHIHSRSHAVALSGSRSYQIDDDAVRIEDSREVSLTGNLFCWHAGHGLLVRNAQWGTLLGNEITDSGSPSFADETGGMRFCDLPPDRVPAHGIALFGVQGYQISANTIFNQAVAPPLTCGIWEDAHSGSNNIVGNSVNYYTGKAVALAGQGSREIGTLGHAAAPYHQTALAAEPDRLLQRFDLQQIRQFLHPQLFPPPPRPPEPEIDPADLYGELGSHSDPGC